MNRSAASLFEELLAVDESTTIEAKAASRMGRSILETVCAFANEPGLGGGHLLLGVVRSPQPDLFGPSYEVEGITNPDQLQADLATQCASSFNRPVRPAISVHRLHDRTVLVAFVPELSPTEKPLFLTSLGLPRGAFRRIGSTDQEGTEDDLVALYEGHQVDTYDGSIVRDTTVSDFDPEAIRTYRELRAAANPVAEELAWADPDLLRALGAVVLEDGQLRPTVGGVLLFGAAMTLRRCFPMMRVDYVRIPGREWVQDPDRRYDTVEIRAPLITAARRAIAAVRDDLPSTFALPEGEALRSDETILPVRVLREAIVNAVMHRSYRIHGPIQILRYANRLEIRNPGHSLKADEQLGEPGSQSRNPRVAAVLHDVHLAETKGSGIRVMRELMVQHDLLPPTFESSRRPDQFVATLLFHHFLGEADLRWVRTLTSERLSDEDARALVFIREMGAIDNAAYRSINRVETLAASAHLRRLRDLGLLEMKGAGNRTYYVARGLGEQAPEADEVHQVPTEVHQSGPDLHQVDGEVHQLPDELEARLRAFGQRPRQDALRSLIRDLCAASPLSARSLAQMLGGRDPKNFVRLHLGPMVESGELAYTIPEMPNHRTRSTPPLARGPSERQHHPERTRVVPLGCRGHPPRPGRRRRLQAVRLSAAVLQAPVRRVGRGVRGGTGRGQRRRRVRDRNGQRPLRHSSRRPLERRASRREGCRPGAAAGPPCNRGIQPWPSRRHLRRRRLDQQGTSSRRHLEKPAGSLLEPHLVTGARA